MPATLSDRTRRIYDRLSVVYPLSTMLFHSQAHRRAVEIANIPNGASVLEVATGSGEMFRRLVRSNRHGQTVGVDLSPNMAARTQRDAARAFPDARARCGAVDSRNMPFRNGSFDAVVCCYLLELLAPADIVRTLREVHRVLRPGGTFALILIGQNAAVFNSLYRVCGKLAPAFWGRQVEERIPALMRAGEFELLRDEKVRQIFYPSRVLIARKYPPGK